MARKRRSLLSDQTKMQLAAAQGAGNLAQPGYYGNLSSRQAGSFTKYALIAAEQALSGQQPNLQAPNQSPNQPLQGP